MKNYRHKQRDLFTGRFAVKNPVKLVPGRLYKWRDAKIRLLEVFPDGQCIVALHKKLRGVVPKNELSLINKRAVHEYLKNA